MRGEVVSNLFGVNERPSTCSYLVGILPTSEFQHFQNLLARLLSIRHHVIKSFVYELSASR